MNKSVIKLLNKKFIISVITSSTFITGCTMAVIWFYLSNIDRLDIFFDAVSLSSALSIIFVFIIVSISGVSLVIFISSFFLMLIYTLHEDDFQNYSSIPHRISTICYLNSLFICCSIIVGYYIYYLYGWNGYFISITGFVLMLAYSYLASYFKLFKIQKFRLHKSDNYEKLPRRIGLLCFLPLQLMTPGIVQILPMLYLLTQLDFSEGTSDWVEMLMLLALTVVIVTIGILPGAIHLNERRNGNKFTGFIVVLICIPVVITVFSILYRPIPNMIINMVMNLSGISDWRTHQYYIESKTHSHSMFNGLIWNTRYYTEIPERFFITGVSTFTLGDIKLVCPTEITEARKESLKFTINDINEYEQKREQLKAVAMKCIPFNKNDIHTWDSPLSEPIYYEKVKQTIDNSMLKILHTLK
ncbi:hypothetical protein [Escherichia coli]|uniref:hypothetical protein n=1 Tax=Escherichia coli TaxID=562 RepID=UPI00191A95AB|nr:hypothetical protein [Escherichia coli]EJV7098108.1 hypothetical protein [Escherichia coli]